MLRFVKSPHLDLTISVARSPYTFISSSADELDADIFESRFLLKRTFFMRGAEASELFYDREIFTRRGAAPSFILKTLFGEGGVQTLVGEAHVRRKELLRQAVTVEHLRGLLTYIESEWETRSNEWTSLPEICLYDECKTLLTAAACRWLELDLAPLSLRERAAQISLLFDGSATLSLNHLRARKARSELEEWITEKVKDVRAEEGAIGDGAHESPLRLISHFRNSKGELLPAQVAAVEILNLLRPIVANAVYLCFGVHAVLTHSVSLSGFERLNPEEHKSLILEIKRFYPFFPVVAARLRKDVAIGTLTMKEGDRAILDLYGTNHDERIWKSPDRFLPSRFLQVDAEITPFNYVPQGGGSIELGHRCIGEHVTDAILQQGLLWMSRLTYDVPDQDMRLDFSRAPALPRSRILLRNVRYFPPLHAVDSNRAKAVGSSL